MGHKAALAQGQMLNAETRAHRDEERGSAQAQEQARIAAIRAQGAIDHMAGSGLQADNDAGRLATGKANRPQDAALTGTGSIRVNQALDAAGVGAND